MHALKIRAAAVTDAARMRAVHRDAVMILCTGYYTRRQVDGWLEAYDESMYLAGIANGSVWVVDDGDVQGFVEAVGDTVTKLFVRPARTMGGLGTALLEHAISQISRAGYVRAYLEATPNSRVFYERRGFKVVGHGYSPQGKPAAKLEVVRMQRPIA
ncbi:GNAT family N-acetyltransferase [Cupriavidus necator]|uniref:GNAT family N-acetyltransferase n=1 Tax=Cupriavidus necator TaxID=106590 RepID=UPI0005B4D1B9|nr:GNAT family N-acetyltransferase [Cupriavidus necator]